MLAEMANDHEAQRPSEEPADLHEADTTGTVAHASGVQLGLLLLLVLVNLLILWVLWTVLSAG